MGTDQGKDKFGEALGIWHITVGGGDFEIKPQMCDIRKMRRIMLKEDNKKNRAGMLDEFVGFMGDMVKRDFPADNKESIEMYVELNCMELFSEALIKFRMATRDDLEKAKAETEAEVKKLIGGN